MNYLKLSPVFEKIAKEYKNSRYIINQGGTSSTKTFSTLQFLTILAIKYPYSIDIVGLTQGHVKAGVIADMPRVTEQFGIDFYKYYSKSEKSLYLKKGTINFISVDTIGKAHGESSELYDSGTIDYKDERKGFYRF